VPYYKQASYRVGATTGFRLAVVAPVITSRPRLKNIEQAWFELGAAPMVQQTAEQTVQLGSEALSDPVKELDVIAEAAIDENMKKRLKNLNATLRASIQERDDQHKLAAKASLRLGAFLCQKLSGDGRAIEALAGIVKSRQDAFGDDDDRLKNYQVQLESERAVLDQILEYYAETVLNSAAIYNKAVLEEQRAVLNTELMRKGYKGVTLFVDQHHRHLSAFVTDARLDRADWLEQCKSLELTTRGDRE
jgi:hypothetical protein